MKRKVPRMTTDEEAEAFLEQDLSDLDFSQFKPVKFEFQAKAARLNMRLPVPLLDAVKARAKARGVPYTRFIREVLEQATTGRPHKPEPLNFALPFCAIPAPCRSTAYVARVPISFLTGSLGLATILICPIDATSVPNQSRPSPDTRDHQTSLSSRRRRILSASAR